MPFSASLRRTSFRSRWVDADTEDDMSNKTMTTEHKERMAAGRRETRAVDAYLRFLEVSGPRTKRREERKRVEAEFDEINEQLPDATSIERLELLQRREDLNRALLDLEETDHEDELERAFIAVAARYSERKGISYSTWREFGVPKPVLEEAGVPRTRRPNKKRSS